MNSDCSAPRVHLWGLIILVWTVISFSPALLGQELTSLSGTVTDPTGAVVPGAKVVLESIGRGTRREVVTGANGGYLFAQVQPDTCRLTASASGFQDVVISDVPLRVNTPATIDIAFKTLGTVTATVTVSASAAQLNTTDASLGNEITTRSITQLPFYARNPIGLFFLQPGVTGFGGADVMGAVNGGKTDQSNMTLDGMDVNDQDKRVPGSVLRVTLDSVQELRMTTSNANADQGRGSGGYVAMVTKSGTNQLHGSLYDYHRGTETAANNFFNNMVGIPRPALLIDAFGASIGGPIKKNHLFYFVNYEGRRDRSAVTQDQIVPNATVRQGIVQYLKTDGTIGQLTPDYIKTNIDPLHIGEDPAILALFQSYPAANDPSGGDGINTLGYRFSSPQHSKEDTYISRIDYTLDNDSKQTLFFRGNLQNDHSGGVPLFPGDPPSSVGLNNSKGLSAGYNFIIKPNLISTLRYGFTRSGVETTGIQSSGMVYITGLTFRHAATTGDARIIPVHQVAEDVTWIHGQHDVRAGGVTRWIRNTDVQPVPFDSADIRANRLYGDGAELGVNVPDLNADAQTYRDMMVAVLGLIGDGTANYRYNLNGNVLPAGSLAKNVNANNEHELYVSDSWKATRSLTVTAGVRWSLMPPIYEATGQQTSVTNLNDWFDQRVALAQQGLPQYSVESITFVNQKDPRWRPVYPYYKKNFAPRFALAYSPQASEGWRKWLTGGHGKTSIRAGWGMFYDMFGSTIAHQLIANQPGLFSSTLSPIGVLTPSTAPRFTGLYDIPSQLIAAPSVGGFPKVLPNDSTPFYSIDSSVKPPYTMNTNFTVEREFAHGYLVQAGYVGRLSRRSIIQRDVAEPADLVDPASHMDYFTAATQLALLARAKTPTSKVGKIPFWEDMWPAAAGNGLTATQAMYNEFKGWGGDATDAVYDIDVNCTPACSKFGPYTMFNQQSMALSVPSSIGKGAYNGMQVTVRKRYGDSLTFDLNYTWSKSEDLSSNPESTGTFGQAMLLNAFAARENWGVSTYDVRQLVNAWAVWQLPFGKGKRFLHQSGRLVDALLGGWQVSGMWTQSTGLPAYVGNGRAWPTDFWEPGYATQIGIIPSGKGDHNGNGPNMFADPAGAYAAYTYTLPGQIGQRYGLRADGQFDIDTGLSKRFSMPYSEHHIVQVRWESFNATNTARFASPTPPAITTTTVLGNPTQFGKYTSMLNPARVMQFALRYEF